MRTSSKRHNSVLVKRNRQEMEERDCILDIVHGSDGTLGIRLLRVSHEAKAAASASVSILDHDLWREKRLVLEGCLRTMELGVCWMVRSGASNVAHQRLRLADVDRNGQASQQRSENTMNGRATYQRTASSTAPNSSNFWRRVASSVCHARPLDR